MAAMQPEQAAAGGSSWTSYISVESIDDAAGRATSAGGTVLAGPTDIGETGRSALVVDSAGAPIGMWEPRQFIGAEHGSPYTSFTVGHERVASTALMGPTDSPIGRIAFLADATGGELSVHRVEES